MPSFEIMNGRFNAEHWQRCSTFKSEGKIVNRKGEYRSFNEGEFPNESLFRLDSKYERRIPYSKATRLGRGAIATIAVLGSCGTVLLSKHIRHLYTEGREKVRFGVPIYVPKDNRRQTSTLEFRNSTTIDVDDASSSHAQGCLAEADTDRCDACCDASLNYCSDDCFEVIICLCCFPCILLNYDGD